MIHKKPALQQGTTSNKNVEEREREKRRIRQRIKNKITKRKNWTED